MELLTGPTIDPELETTNELVLVVRPEEALGDEETVGFGDAVGVALGVCFTVGIALGVALGDTAGVGFGVAITVGTGAGTYPPPPDPPPPDPPPDDISAVIENVRTTEVAAAYVVSPACEAVTLQVPSAVKLTVLPVTVQFPEAENATVSPEVLVAVTVKGPGSG